MNFLQTLKNIRLTIKSDADVEIVDTPAPAKVAPSPILREERAVPYIAYSSPMQLYNTLPEIFWAVDFIASRIAGAHFDIKRTKDDSIVWCNKRMNKILTNPNCLMTWRELVYSHYTYSLVTGNGFIRAAMAETAKDLAKYRWCDNFWSLPADCVDIEPVRTFNIPLFGICTLEEIVAYYRLSYSYARGDEKIPVWQVWHDRDLKPEYTAGRFLKSNSRLLSVLKPISNLIAVYEARNVIYVKRGGIGFLINENTDVTGHVPMTDEEKKELMEEMDRNYGVTNGRNPLGFSNQKLGFIRTNLSISDLQPFDETLEDAIKIAGAFGIPAVLVPRKDQSTFSNQATAEKAVYTSTIIPMTKRFCEAMTTFLGLDKDGYYLDCNFADVDCLQLGLKEAEQVKQLTFQRCINQFSAGLITLNDIRAQMHESCIPVEEDPLFSKLKYQMDEQELQRVERVMKNINSKIDNNNPKTSTGEEHERNDEESEVSDESK